MAEQIVHRGPDDSGVCSAGQVSIGMRRLSIIDLVSGHQPIANEDGTVHVVCNGEIYNFRELRRELTRAGHRFRTRSDTEVIVHAYEEYGDRFLDHVRGMFAIAVLDGRQNRLLLARDRMGIKPLYYAVVDGTLCFASEVKALLTTNLVGRDIDPPALHEFLTLGYAPAPLCLFRGVRKLPPAHFAVWQDDLSIHRYWSLPAEVDQSLSEDEWVESTRELLHEVVADQMVSDVPLGAFLSGGIDSSAVVAAMSEVADAPVSTYSIGYVGGAAARHYNELPYAHRVAERFSTRHAEIPVSPKCVDLLPTIMSFVEEPVSDSAMVTTFLVAQLAAQDVKVILSGVGGDELFGGYNRYLGGHYLRLYRRLPRWMRQHVLRPLAANLPSGRQSRFMDLCRYAKRFAESDDLDWGPRYRRYMAISGSDRSLVLDKAQICEPDLFDRIIESEVREDDLLRLLSIDARTQLPEDLLLLTDKMTMAHSIECRVPLLDERLVEHASRIPAHVKIRGGNLKHVLKRAVEGLLPKEIVHRRKRGFGAPFGEWLKSESRPLRDHLVRREVIEARGVLDWDAVSAALDEHDRGREDFTDLLTVLVNLEIWARLFLDGRSARDVSDELRELSRADVRA